MTKRLATLAIVVSVTTFTSASRAAEYGSFDGSPTYVYRNYFTLYAGYTYTFETKNLSAGGDTMLYLWDPVTGQQVAYNDDYAGLASRIVYQPPQTRTYMLIIRAYSTGSAGSCELWYNGSFYGSTPFGGWKTSAGGQNDDIVETVHLQDGVNDTFLALLTFWWVGPQAGNDPDGLRSVVL